MYSLFVALAASGVLIAGCGSSSKPKPKATTTKPAATTTAPKTSTTPTTSTAPALSGAALKEAVTGCESAEAHVPNGSVKSYLSAICSDLESGNIAAFKADVAKYCSALVAASPSSTKALAETECQEVDKL
jgi:hypothetical protein